MEEKHTPSTMSSTDKPQTAEPAKHPRRWPWILGGVILLLGIIAFYTHRQPQGRTSGGRYGGGGTNALMISTAAARTGDIGVYVNALGIVTPVYTISVEARVAGQIVRVNYQEGQRVSIGDSLVEIDPAPYQAAVVQAEGQLARDTALLEDANLDLNRYKEAYESNAIPKQQYDTQVATVHQDEGIVRLDQGNLDSAKVNLEYCHITSPINGRVGLRLVDPGNLVQANGTTPLVVVTQTQPITVIFTVAEDYLPQILPSVHQGKKLAMDVFDRENQTKITTGTLETLDNQINTSSGTLRLRGVCSNEDESLFPNQFVNVHLLVNTLHGVTLLPNTAIQRNSDTAFVYSLQTNNTVEMHSITVGVTDGTVSQVEDLDAGAVVAADNFNRLTDGAKVTIRPGSEAGPGQRQGQRQGRRQGQGQGGSGHGSGAGINWHNAHSTNAATDEQDASATE